MLFNNQTSYILMTIHFIIFTFFHRAIFYDVFLPLSVSSTEKSLLEDRQESIKILCFSFFLVHFGKDEKFLTPQTGKNLRFLFLEICVVKREVAEDKVKRLFPSYFVPFHHRISINSHFTL